MEEVVNAMIKLSGRPGDAWWFWMPFYMSIALSNSSFRLLGHYSVMTLMTIGSIGKNVLEYLKKKNPWD